MLYLNDGDWVESCTALVEHRDGTLELIDWVARNKLSPLKLPTAKPTMSKAALAEMALAELAAAQRDCEPNSAAPASA